MSSGAASPSGGGPASRAATTRVRDVVRDVVAATAPEELLLVDGLAGLDDDVVIRRLGRRGARREPLGFGLGEIAALVTPVVWLMVDEAARRVGTAAVDGAAARTKAVLRKVFRRRAAAVFVPDLTRDELAEIHRRVRETAVEHGLGDSRARLIADAVVGRLALAAPELDAREPDGPADGAPLTKNQ
ncbi:hypothetical protein ACIBQ6_26725 [Nonomuraea sp. NPDC049655]|uniref:hypothetical protein n=1 Tax=Nonomuraea sp. NPDC049655 TaxID=3364355 RepID=UPI00379AE0A6